MFLPRHFSMISFIHLVLFSFWPQPNAVSSLLKLLHGFIVCSDINDLISINCSSCKSHCSITGALMVQIWKPVRWCQNNIAKFDWLLSHFDAMWLACNVTLLLNCTSCKKCSDTHFTLRIGFIEYFPVFQLYHHHLHALLHVQSRFVALGTKV